MFNFDEIEFNGTSLFGMKSIFESSSCHNVPKSTKNQLNAEKKYFLLIYRIFRQDEEALCRYYLYNWYRRRFQAIHEPCSLYLKMGRFVHFYYFKSVLLELFFSHKNSTVLIFTFLKNSNVYPSSQLNAKHFDLRGPSMKHLHDVEWANVLYFLHLKMVE